MNIGGVIGIVCGGFLGVTGVVFFVIYFGYRRQWFSGHFGAVGEEVRGVPLQSRAPRLSEEQRRRRERRKRRRVPPTGRDGETGSLGTPHSRGSHSRWFRCSSAASSATVASSAAVYGRGAYISQQNAQTPTSRPFRRRSAGADPFAGWTESERDDTPRGKRAAIGETTAMSGFFHPQQTNREETEPIGEHDASGRRESEVTSSGAEETEVVFVESDRTE